MAQERRLRASGATWEALAVGDADVQVLRDLIARARRGPGVCALFTGPSGTGKTLAAGVIAKDLGLPLYRISLSAVVSKYIGETEKNLRRVFDTAESADSVLVFDDADALFGKRSEVDDGRTRNRRPDIDYVTNRVRLHRGLIIFSLTATSEVDHRLLRDRLPVVTFAGSAGPGGRRRRKA